MSSREDITALLARGAIDEIYPLVYDELKRIAQRQVRRRGPGGTLNATALVHEAYLRLVDQTQVQWQNRLHFFAVAATAMRRILINYAQRKQAQKRGGKAKRVTFKEALVDPGERAQTLVELDEALKQLAALDPRLGKVVELRFFGGLTELEIGQLLGVSERTVRRDWRKARMLLGQSLTGPGPP